MHEKAISDFEKDLENADFMACNLSVAMDFGVMATNVLQFW